MRTEIYNTGVKSIPLGRNKHGFPTVLHPKKSIVVESGVADKLCDTYDCIIKYVGDISKSSKKKKKESSKHSPPSDQPSNQEDSDQIDIKTEE